MSSRTQPAESPNTRATILRAGQKLLRSDQPFSMGGVAELAGVSRQALYLHFADRYALLEAIVDEVIAATSIDESRHRIAKARTGREALHHFVGTMVRVSASHGAIDQAVRATLAADPKLARRWARREGRRAIVRAIAEQLRKEDAVRPGVSVVECAEVIDAFTSPELLVRLLGALPRDGAVELLHRALSAAVLRSA